MEKLLYADDLALVVNVKQALQKTRKEWNGLFTRHGLTINLEKTEVQHIDRSPEGRVAHRDGGEETDSGGQFRVPRRDSV